MTDFTPGPWEVQSSPQGRFGADWKLINGPNNSYVVSTDSYIRRQGGEDTCYHGVDISEANATLIAQAPALYEALEAAVSVQVFNNWVTAGETVCCVCGELPESLRHDDDCWAGKALAVLATARGEQ